MDKELIRQVIREELAFMIKNKKLVFPYPMQILDGNDITLGKTVGTRFGNGTDQKFAFLGSNPRVRAPLGTIIQPTGGTVVDNEARARINDLNSLVGSVAGFGLAETIY